MAKVNDKKLRETLPTLLTPPDISLWDRSIERQRNEYHRSKFKKNAPTVEQEKFVNVINALRDYKETQERLWKGNGNGNGKRRNNVNAFSNDLI